MTVALLIALQVASPVSAIPATAIEAERAFVHDAQTIGQWTAVRKWSTSDAVMFAPLPVKAHELLAKAKDPPIPVFWWPGRSYVSCDGKLAFNTGPWVRDYGKSVGYFTTVWVRQPDGGWKWIYDGGDELKFARDEGGDIKPVIASCSGKPTGAVVLGTIAAAGHRSGGGRSDDGSLIWSWTTGPKGDRRFLAQLWDGQRWQPVIDDRVAAPPPR
jgi:hypothetical protein